MGMNEPNKPENADTRVTAEQQRCATLLQWGARLGFGLLVATFIPYLLGWLPVRIPHGELAHHWGKPVRDYLAAMNMTDGWDWLHHLGDADVLPLLGVTALASLPTLCFFTLTLLYVRKRDWLYAGLCFAELLVLALATSGLLQN